MMESHGTTSKTSLLLQGNLSGGSPGLVPQEEFSYPQGDYLSVSCEPGIFSNLHF